MKDVDCYKRANVSKQTWYKILNEKDYRPSKNTIIAFAIALELTLDEDMVWKNKEIDHNYFNGYSLTENDFYKVYSVPIKFNKTYTIAIDAPTGLLMKPLLRDTHGFIETIWDEDKKEKVKIGKYDEFDLKSIPYSLFLQPFTFRVDTTNKSLYGLQRYLNLYI